jgi:hypothetical protein
MANYLRLVQTKQRPVMTMKEELVNSKIGRSIARKRKGAY